MKPVVKIWKWMPLAVLALSLCGCERIQSGFQSTSPQEQTAAGLQAYRAGKVDEARKLWSRAAKEGGTEAAYYLGVLITEGHGGDAAEALGWFEKAAAKGNPKAQYNLALAYERGLGTTRDRAKAIGWLSKAAAQNDNDAQYMLGLLLIDEAGDPPAPTKADAALEWIRKAAESGNARASFQLGTIYSDGDLAPVDLEQAAHWYQKALAGGMIETLRPLLSARKTLAELDERSFATLQEQASRGDARAQHLLAGRFFKGLGVARDVQKGTQWLNKAAYAGDAEAQYDLGVMLIGSDTSDMAAGFKWLRKAAAQNYPRAQYAVARAYAQGAGMEKDEAVAVSWYRLAAEQSLPEAEYAMGYVYSEGSGVQRDDGQAMHWFRRAAMHGHEEAAFRISTMYANGEGVVKDPNEVRRWECRAVVLGSTRASGNLAKYGGIEGACPDYAEDLAKFAVDVLGVQKPPSKPAAGKT